MSYTLTLACGCLVYVWCDPITRAARTRIIERRAPDCVSRRHQVGAHMFLWDLLPDRPRTREEALDESRPG